MILDKLMYTCFYIKHFYNKINHKNPPKTTKKKKKKLLKKSEVLNADAAIFKNAEFF